MTQKKSNAERVSVIAVGANLFLFLIKLFAGLISGSYAVLADAVNSGSDIFASGINYIGIKISKKPSDKNHPYGHQKYEVLVGLVVTLVIFGSAIYIIYNSVTGLFNPSPIEMSVLAITIMIISSLTNEVMARLKIKTGKKENSIALVADGVHSRIDVLSSAAVVVGLAVSKYWIYADSVVALGVGLWILKESFSLGKEATDNLTDVSAGEEKEESIKKVVKEEGIEIADLKTQKRGNIFSANLTVSLPSNLKVEEATSMTEKLRQRLLNEISDLGYVVISIEGSNKSTSYYRGFSWGGGGYAWRSSMRSKDQKHPHSAIHHTGNHPRTNPGSCICPKCGHKEGHERGVPCATIRCPKCNIPLTRELKENRKPKASQEKAKDKNEKSKS